MYFLPELHICHGKTEEDNSENSMWKDNRYWFNEMPEIGTRGQ